MISKTSINHAEWNDLFSKFSKVEKPEAEILSIWLTSELKKERFGKEKYINQTPQTNKIDEEGNRKPTKNTWHRH